MKTRMIIAGGSGFLGRALQRFFETQGWQVIVLSRHPTGCEIFWDGKSQGPWSSQLEGALAVINLAGRSVNCRYNAKNRAEMMDSRIESTRAIGEAIRSCQNSPRVWINASTATIYRHTYGEPWGEDGDISATDEANDALSIEIAQAWEYAVNSAETPSTRKILLRAAMVLGNGPNSVFPTLRRLARFGLGGRMGSGRQYVSWIHERDFCRAVQWIIQNEGLRGPVNISAPGPVTNAEMMRMLRLEVGAPVCRRPNGCSGLGQG